MRWLLMLLAFAGSTLVGMLLWQRQIRRIRILEAVGKMLQEMEMGMLGQGDSLLETMDRISRESSEAAKLAELVAEGLRAAPEEGFPLVWSQSVDRLTAQDRYWMALAPEDEPLLKGLGGELSVMDARSLARSLETLRGRYAVRLEEARAQAAQTSRMARSVGVLLGLILVILML